MGLWLILSFDFICICVGIVVQLLHRVWFVTRSLWLEAARECDSYLLFDAHFLFPLLFFVFA